MTGGFGDVYMDLAMTKKRVTIPLIVVGMGLCLGACFIIVSWSASIYHTLVGDLSQPGGSPMNISITANGLALISDMGARSPILPTPGPALWIVDTRTDTQLKILKVRNAGEIFATSSGPAYLLSEGNSFIEVVDPSNLMVTEVMTVPINGNKFSTVFTKSLIELSNKDVLLTANQSLYVVDHRTRQMKLVANFDHILNSMLFLLSREKIYVASYAQIHVLTSNSFAVVGEVQNNPPNANLNHLRFISDRAAVASYDRGGQNGLVLVDLIHDEVINTLELEDRILGIVKVSDSKIYVLQGQSGSVVAYYISVIDLTSFQQTRRIKLPPEPYLNDLSGADNRLALSPNGKVYVVHGYDFVNQSSRDDKTQGIVGLYIVDPSLDQLIGEIPFSQN